MMGPAFRERLKGRRSACHLPRWIREDGTCEHPAHDHVGDLRSMVRADAAELSHARGFHRELVLRLRADLRAARAAGATLGELAQDAGISRTRVAQVLNDGRDEG